MANPTPARRAEVRARDGNKCKRCGRWVRVGTGSIHHRQPRGMGGSRDPDKNALVNLALVCGSGTTGCHGYIESHRDEARLKGWLVPMGMDPAQVPWTV